MLPGIEALDKGLERIGYRIHTVLQLHHASILPRELLVSGTVQLAREGTNVLWRWDILVLTVEVVLSAELARSGFVALLFAGAAMVASLRCSNLLPSHVVLRC